MQSVCGPMLSILDRLRRCGRAAPVGLSELEEQAQISEPREKVVLSDVHMGEEVAYIQMPQVSGARRVLSMYRWR